MNLHLLKLLVLNSEEFLIEKILGYAIEMDYSRYTSTLREAWRMSIQGLSEAMIKIIDKNGSIPELGPDIDYSKSEIAEFGIKEARLHRSRGITLHMFLGFMKYYQQSYEDMVKESNLDQDDKNVFIHFIKRYFDYVELGFTMEWTEISEQKMIDDLQSKNRDIQNEKNKYLTVFESIYDPVILVNQDNIIENINNKAAEVFLGIERPGINYYGNTDVASTLGWLLEDIGFVDIHENNTVISEKDIKTHVGTRTFQIKLTRMMDVSKKYNGAVIIFSDITERLEIERQKQEIDATLRQHQKLESIGTLASGVAHEINNPINGIMNYGQLIIDMELNLQDVNEYATEIIAESERISEITKNLLEFSRQNKQAHNYAQIYDIIRNSLSIIGSTLRYDQIEVVLQLPEGISQLKCRSQQIQQVLMNLITNSRDSLNLKYPGYDDDKKIYISAREYRKDERKWIRVSVRDNGSGIPEEIQQRVFDPFFTTKSRAEGTGLGLSVSYGIIEEHHGEITFETKEGEYAVFHVDLPCDNGWNLD